MIAEDTDFNILFLLSFCMVLKFFNIFNDVVFRFFPVNVSCDPCTEVLKNVDNGYAMRINTTDITKTAKRRYFDTASNYIVIICNTELLS